MKRFLVFLLSFALMAGAVMAAGCSQPTPNTDPPPVTDETTPDTDAPVTDETTPDTDAPVTDETTPDTDAPVTDETTPDTDAPGTDTPEVRYTVTEEEWNAWTTYPNYTIDQSYGEYRVIHKYTADALQFEDGSTILFVGDKQYRLEETEDGYAAYDCTDLAYSHSGLLSGGYVYDEFTYDEELGAYVLDMLEEMGSIWEVRFENGVPVSILYREYTDGEVSLVVSSTYINVGTTVIDIPDYEIREEPVIMIRREVTEEEWNIGVNIDNYSGNYFSYVDGTFESYSYRCAGNALEINGTIYIFEDGKTYVLVEDEGVWTATEVDNSSDPVMTVLPRGLRYEDFEFSADRSGYVPKAGPAVDLNLVIGFADGQLAFITTQGSLNPDDPAYGNMIAFEITEIGNAVIEIPDYVMAEE